MKLGWVVTCTTHCPVQFFLLLSKLFVWPFSYSLVHATGYMLLTLQFHEVRRLQPYLHKAGLNWSKSWPNDPLFIQTQAPHMGYTAHTIQLVINQHNYYYYYYYLNQLNFISLFVAQSSQESYNSANIFFKFFNRDIQGLNPHNFLSLYLSLCKLNYIILF